MPLRHSTETALLIILGLVIAVTGFLIATLPPLPGGILPWAVLMALSVAHPILLTPFFRARRADTPLRSMHWFPAAMLLVWFLIEAATLYLPILSSTQAVYTVLWTLPAVALGILTLVLYCLNVIRRRVPRISALLLTFIAFVALAFAVLIMYSRRAPQMIAFAATQEGVRIGSKFYKFSDLKSFWVFNMPEVKELSLETEKTITPFIRLPLGDTSAEEIKIFLRDFLPEEEHKDFASDQIARSMGL